MHLLVTSHHGLRQGAKKEKGEKALCACCLRNGHRIEETAQHEHHDCPTARAVWQQVAAAWLQATGESVDINSPLLTIMGLRARPADLTGAAREKWDALEPAWRLTHAVTLRQIHQARCRSHNAAHAKTPYEPKHVQPKHIIKYIRTRLQLRLTYEHTKARHDATHARRRGALAAFQTHWISTGVATMRKTEPRLSLFSATLPMDSPPPGAIHIRCCGALAPGTSRKPASSGWALSNHGVRPDGVEEELRRAHGAVPAQCTHAGTAPPHAAPGHTQKAAQQAAVTHALGCASRWLKQPHVTVIITVDSPTTLHDLQSEAAPRGRRRQQPPAAAAAAEQHAHQGREESSGKRRRKAPPQSGNKRTRTGADEDGGVDEAPQPSLQRTARLRKNQDLLRSLRSQHGARLRLRAERGPSPQELVKQASLAARLQDLDIIRLEAGIERREPAQWDELRVWDPGDG